MTLTERAADEDRRPDGRGAGRRGRGAARSRSRAAAAAASSTRSASTAARQAGDHELEFHGVKVVVDPFSAPYLQGSTIDFLEALQESGFKIENPNAPRACGCGHSFQVADGEAPDGEAGCGSGCGHAH